MSKELMYNLVENYKPDAEERLFSIINLALAGAAATDTAATIKHPEAMFCGLFEQIFTLAIQVVDMIEEAEDARKKAGG